MKIAIVAAEISPWAKAGGLADVIGALPAALKRAGADPVVILPGYSSILTSLAAKQIGGLMTTYVGVEPHQFRVLRVDGPNGVPFYLIDHPGFFARDGVYGERGSDYPDNLRRFVFFGKAAAMVAAEIVQPDVVHAHDWHAAVAPIVIRGAADLRARLSNAIVAYTVHNLAFQGIYDASDFPLLGIDWSNFTIDGLEFYGRMNLMKGAIMMADGVSTVSPSYAREVVTDPTLGFGLEGVLRGKGDRFVGILNGADYREWDPAGDMLIASTYTPQRPAGKRVCTRDLRDSLKLPERDDWPLIGMVTRMTSQKGCDLLRDALDELMALDVQLVMLASGEPALEQFFNAGAQRYHDRLRVITQFDNSMAHRIQAGSDAFLMPSRFEPCGLTQMYALKYGTAPIVRATGGLRDTVTEFDPTASIGNGFVFDEYRTEALVDAVRRMATVFAKPPVWRRLVQNCFAADFSWDRAARNYLDWFSHLGTPRGVKAA
ncbi:MAG: glycogen synthase GlgA [Candidatus Binataceae bacterium]